MAPVTVKPTSRVSDDGAQCQRGPEWSVWPTFRVVIGNGRDASRRSSDERRLAPHSGRYCRPQ
jgi:hypothetical protein